MFMLVLFVYQVFVLVRVPCLCCTFIFGKRLWTWCKRSCGCLNTVETERTATFSVYQAQEYVQKVNSEAQKQTDRLDIDDLSCAICLEDFNRKDVAAKADQSQIVALSCNARHTFHAGCLE
mmetsp:Transcript_5679/g.7610  ORF Transcript_5679/g.7610 Transcript_5679/m.7610 type:complete len:121 (+) Transcript_5679:622-984(+)